MKKEKRGFLIAEGLIKLLLAILALGIAFSAGCTFFKAYLGSTEEHQAKGTLQDLTAVIQNLSEGEQKSFLLLAPQGWHLVSFDVQSAKNSYGDRTFEKPSQLIEHNLICICKTSACKTELCSVIAKPMHFEGAELLNYKIEIKDLLIRNTETAYLVSDVDAFFLTDSEIETIKVQSVVAPSQDAVDAWLKEKAPELEGLSACAGKASQNYDVPKNVILAVAVQETRSKKELATDAGNMLGILGIGTHERRTYLFENNNYARYNARCESFMHFAKIVAEDPRLSEAWQNRADKVKMITSISLVWAEKSGEWANAVTANLNEIEKIGQNVQGN